MSPIFISHAVADKPLVDTLYDLLQTGCDIRGEDLICTSVDGAGIQTGEEFVDWIKAKLVVSNFIILTITPNYFASKFCMAEMGAVWALDKKVFPLVIPNIPREIGIVMLGRQTAEINEAGLDELRDEIVKFYPEAGRSTPRWSAKKQLFLANLGGVLGKLPQPNLIDRAALSAEQEKNQAFVQMLQELEMRMAEDRNYIEKLEQLKDKETVDELKLRSLPASEQYELLLQAVKEEISGYSVIEVRCLYASFVDDWWHPSIDAWGNWESEIKVAVNSNWIHQYRDEDVYMTNRSHPRYESAIVSIEKLGEYIRQMDKKLKSMIQEKEKYEVDIYNLEYWSQALWKPYLMNIA